MNSNITEIIKISNLTKRYGKNVVLNIDDFCFYNHNTYLLIGANGAGKSTLIKLIVGLIKATSGNIKIKTDEVAYVPEKFTFPDNITVYDFLDKLLRVKTKEKMNDKINYILEWWNIDKDKRISALSKGMKQKILIIQAILKEVDLYIFDEPLNGLDINAQTDFLTILKRLKELGKTIIVCTHYDKYYASFFDYFIYFDGGKISEVKKSH